VHSFSFDDNQQRVRWWQRGCRRARRFSAGPAARLPFGGNDLAWNDARIAEFLAGGPLRLGWITQPVRGASRGVGRARQLRASALARNLLGARRWTTDYIDRVRERLATGNLIDAAFDYLLPPVARSKSMVHWTPITVARAWPCDSRRTGPAAFSMRERSREVCVVAGSVSPRVTFLGIEQRGGFGLGGERTGCASQGRERRTSSWVMRWPFVGAV